MIAQQDLIKKSLRNERIRKRSNVLLVLIFSLILITLFLSNVEVGFATSSVNATNTTMVIWDDTDNGANKYTYNSHCNLSWKNENYWNVNFFTNYTKNDTGESINDSDGECNIRFDEDNTGSYGSWDSMNYNSSSERWEYNRSFTAKGLLDWQVNCTTTLTIYENLDTSDDVEIKNSEPCISGKGPGNRLNSFACDEDITCYYNFSSNCSDDDLNDILDYVISNINSSNKNYTNYSWFSINSSTGIITIDATMNNQTGDYDLSLIVGDSDIEGTGTSQDITTLPVNISSVNDQPYFVSLPVNATEGTWFNFNVTVADEENNLPYNYNVSFLSNCSLANWSSRSNCSLFTIDPDNGNISFLPTNDDVGNYTANFTVIDSGNPNATNSSLVSFEVINVNNLPFFNYVCNNERNASEDTLFNCWINGSDDDEIYNLTFVSNYTWFTFNNSQNNITVVVDGGNASALVEFTPDDSAVGNYLIDIWLTDSGGSTNNTIISFSVNNSNDDPLLPALANKNCYNDALCTQYINATDDDLLIPGAGKLMYNESLNFSSNSSIFNITKFYEVYDGSSSLSIGLVNFTPTGSDIGVHYINISVTDEAGLMNYTIWTLTIGNNSAPEWNESKEYNFNLTEDSNFYLSISEYVTDENGDNLTFYHNLSGSEFPSFNLTSEGIINFTPLDADVGLHNVELKAGDGIINSSHLFVFNVSNVHDNPIMQEIPDTETQEANYTLISFYGQDDDLLIQQKSVYDENLTFSRTITNLSGEYRSLFNLTVQTTTENRTNVLINFTPVEEDVGNYTVTINVTDMNGLINSTSFNLTIRDLNNAPEFNETIGTQHCGVDYNFSMNVSARDEDNDTLTFSANYTWFTFNNSQSNITVAPQNNKTATALVNFTCSAANAGIKWINLSVADSNLSNSTVFAMKIHDQPVVVGMTCQNISENSTLSCSAIITQAVNNNVNCSLVLVNATLGNKENASSCNLGNVNLTIQTNFTFEGIYSVMINASNPFYSGNAKRNVTINHSNAPPVFHTSISDIIASGSSTTINLSEHFYDADHDDPKYNQTINFTYAQFDTRSDCSNDSGSVSTFTIDISSQGGSYIASFSSDESASAIIKITAIDSQNATYNASSNCFSINLTVESPPTPAPRDEGGATTKKPLTIRIIPPTPFSLSAVGSITVPIKIQNTGVASISDITINASAEREGIYLELLRDHIDSLDPTEIEEINLTITTNVPEVIDIEPTSIEVFAYVARPKMEDSAKILFNLIEIDRELRLKAEEKKNMLNEYIISNPECLELKEALDNAVLLFAQGDYSGSMDISENAIQACKSLIGKSVLLGKLDWRNWPTLALVLIGSIVVLFVVVFSSYFIFKRKKFK